MEYWRFHQPQTANLRKIKAGVNVCTAIMLRNITNHADLKDSKLFLDAIFKGGSSLRLALPVHRLVLGRPLLRSNLDTLLLHKHILVSLTPRLLLWLSGFVPPRRGRDFWTLVSVKNQPSSAVAKKSDLLLHQRRQSKMPTFWSKLNSSFCCGEEEEKSLVIGEPFDFERVEVELAVLSEHEPDCESGNFFFELSHYFLATIVKQHQDSLFEGRQLPSEDEIFEVFQRAEPRPRGSGLGPYLEELTGVETLDPELMPEVLLQLERRLASHTSTSKTSWPVPKDMVSVDSDRQLALRHEISQLESLVERNQIRSHDSLDVDVIEHGLNSGLDAPKHVAPRDDSEDLEDDVGSPQHWDAHVSMTDDANMDGSINQDRWVAADFELDLRGLDPEILTAEEVAAREKLLKRDAEAAAGFCQSSHDQTNGTEPLDVLRDERMEPMNHGPDEQHYQTEPQPDFTSLSRRQRYERIAGRELSCDTSQMDSSPWSPSQPDLAADQSLTFLSDLPDFDELMQDVPDEANSSQQQMV
ncbi:hypothetical protein KCU86_g100, partial [Aureobasidium melanogenum]